MNPPDPGRAERELEELLRRAAPEQPDPARRAEARRAFLAAGRTGAGEPSRAGSSARMGSVMDKSSGEGLTGGSEEAFAAWLATVAPAVPPSPEVQRRVRLAFLSAVASAPPPLRAQRTFRRVVWAAAAAAILVVTFLLPEPERWSVQLDGRLTFDGGEFLPGDEARLGAALERSGTIETALARAHLELGGDLALELLTDSALVVPPLTELDGVAPLEFELARGEAYVRTGPAYPGNPIIVRTALANVSLHGTTVGVLVDELGTCVCVADGTARVSSARLATGSQDVGPRHSLRVFTDPGMGPKLEAFPAQEEAEAAHTADLVAFQRAP